jgi:hypothetical protein
MQIGVGFTKRLAMRIVTLAASGTKAFVVTTEQGVPENVLLKGSRKRNIQVHMV